MATIKSFTDISQSKKLAEILPLESVDMEYLAIKDNGQLIGSIPFVKDDSEVEDSVYSHIYDRIACWSLTALLEMLSKCAEHVNEAGIAELSYEKVTKWCVSMLNCGKIKDCYADNPIDACYKMIIELHELNLL